MKKFKMYMKPISVKTLYNMYHEDVPEIDFTDDMQRGEVWSNSQKSQYIHSILLRITDAQSPFIAGVRDMDNGNQLFKIFDGKQRGTTLIHFLNGDFSLIGLNNEPDIYLNNEIVQIKNKRFKQLPRKLQEWIEDTTINVAVLENATPEMEALIFRRLNNGKSMSRFDLARSYKQEMEDIKKLSKHEIFTVMLSDKEIKALRQQEIIVKLWMVLFMEEPDLIPTKVNEVMKTLQISDDEQEQITTSLDFIFRAYKLLKQDSCDSSVIKAMFRVTHMVGYIAFISKFDTPEQFAEWIKTFFNNMPDEYSSFTQAHTTGSSSIKARKRLIENSINEFLGK